MRLLKITKIIKDYWIISGLPSQGFQDDSGILRLSVRLQDYKLDYWIIIERVWLKFKPHFI